MSKKKPPTTIEECNAEMELTQKKIRQYENRNKMLDRKLAIEKRKERNHRLCSRGATLKALSRHSLICQNRKPATSSTPRFSATKRRSF